MTNTQAEYVKKILNEAYEKGKVIGYNKGFQDAKNTILAMLGYDRREK
jgi:hypothetical protein